MSILLNASTSTGLGITSDNSGSIEVQSNGTTKLTVSSTGVSGTITSDTAKASTSGTSIDFTGIPSWVKKITVMFNGVSTNGTSTWLIQIGSGSVETTGYVSGYSVGAGSGASTAGFIMAANQAAANTYSGHVIITNISGNVWVSSSITIGSSSAVGTLQAGTKTASGVLDRVRITTTNGTDTFDAGTINIFYEG